MMTYCKIIFDNYSDILCKLIHFYELIHMNENFFIKEYVGLHTYQKLWA